MDIEELVKSHSKALDKQVENCGHIKDKLLRGECERRSSQSLHFKSRLFRLAAIYSVMVFAFLLFNFKIIGWLKQNKPSHETLAILENPFQPIIPGSITQAYMEVGRWHE